MFLKARCLKNEKQKYCFYSPEEKKKENKTLPYVIFQKQRLCMVTTKYQYIESEVNCNMVELNKIVLRIASQCYLECICDSVKILENSTTK